MYLDVVYLQHIKMLLLHYRNVGLEKSDGSHQGLPSCKKIKKFFGIFNDDYDLDTIIRKEW